MQQQHQPPPPPPLGPRRMLLRHLSSAQALASLRGRHRLETRSGKSRAASHGASFELPQAARAAVLTWTEGGDAAAVGTGVCARGVVSNTSVISQVVSDTSVISQVRALLPLRQGTARLRPLRA